MRRAEEVIRLLAVLEAEQVVAVLGPAVGLLVGLAGQQRREGDLLGADAVHFLAHDVLDVAQHLQAQRQPGVDAGGVASDVAGPDEELVAGDLGIGRVVPQGAQEQP